MENALGGFGTIEQRLAPQDGYDCAAHAFEAQIAIKSSRGAIVLPNVQVNSRDVPFARADGELCQQRGADAEPSIGGLDIDILDVEGRFAQSGIVTLMKAEHAHDPTVDLGDECRKSIT